MMLTTVKLYGHLRKRFGKQYKFDIDTVAEAFRALEANFKGFRQYLIEHSEPGYRVIVNGRAIGEEELQLAVSVPTEIKLVPVVQGAGDGKGIGMIILGVVLAVVAVVITAGYGAAFLGVYAGTVASVAGSMAVGMIAGGITQLLAPGTAATNLNDKNQSQQSTLFGRAEETALQGLPVPIGYGTMIVEGYPVSIRITVEN